MKRQKSNQLKLKWGRLGICLIALCCILPVWGCSQKAEDISYQESLFDTTFVHTIEITLAQEDWDYIKANAIEKADYHGDITIDGKKLKDVCISTKGSNSLRSAISDEGTNRYSLKIKFGKFKKGQTYCGLDVLDLNNNYSDPSLMKDFITYEMFREMGVAAPLASYAKVTVNGEAYGVFLAVEEINSSFLKRNFGGDGQLYKPESKLLTEISNHNGQVVQEAAQNGTAVDKSLMRSPRKEMSPYTSGADLRYTDEKIESYPDIFDNSKTKADEEAMNRVIQALKKLSEGDVENAVDVDEVITYFALHNFTCNYDSYTGLFGHNYFLYENGGLLSMLPWDYNYNDSLCTDERAKAIGRSMVDTHVDMDIDQPLTLPEDSRPMWNWIASDEKYLAQYHSEMSRFIEQYVESGWAEDEIARVNEMIRAEVQADTNKSFTIDEYDAAVADLVEYFRQRGESIRGQLE